MRGEMTHLFRNIDEIRSNWGWFLTLGLALIVLGIGVISFAVYATFFSVLLLGIFLLCSGIVQIIQGFMAAKWSGLFLSLLIGILSAVVGLFCIVNPPAAAVAITLWIAAFCFVAGLFKIFTSAILQFEQWGWVLFNGIVTLLLGILIYADWPLSGLWVIGLFVGIDMILAGWAWVLLSLALKSGGSQAS